MYCMWTYYRYFKAYMSLLCLGLSVFILQCCNDRPVSPVFLNPAQPETFQVKRKAYLFRNNSILWLYFAICSTTSGKRSGKISTHVYLRERRRENSGKNTRDLQRTKEKHKTRCKRLQNLLQHHLVFFLNGDVEAVCAAFQQSWNVLKLVEAMLNEVFVLRNVEWGGTVLKLFAPFFQLCWSWACSMIRLLRWSYCLLFPRSHVDRNVEAVLKPFVPPCFNIVQHCSTKSKWCWSKCWNHSAKQSSFLLDISTPMYLVGRLNLLLSCFCLKADLVNNIYIYLGQDWRINNINCPGNDKRSGKISTISFEKKKSAYQTLIKTHRMWREHKRNIGKPQHKAEWFQASQVF